METRSFWHDTVRVTEMDGIYTSVAFTKSACMLAIPPMDGGSPVFSISDDGFSCHIDGKIVPLSFPSPSSLKRAMALWPNVFVVESGASGFGREFGIGRENVKA